MYGDVFFTYLNYEKSIYTVCFFVLQNKKMQIIDYQHYSCLILDSTANCNNQWVSVFSKKTTTNKWLFANARKYFNCLSIEYIASKFVKSTKRLR
ncbi:MAG: hypothetical protein ACI85I_002475 [Arenicella sp.]|jgi:hypothetical protein